MSLGGPQAELKRRSNQAAFARVDRELAELEAVPPGKLTVEQIQQLSQCFGTLGELEDALQPL